jgi:hypothetical protein
LYPKNSDETARGNALELLFGSEFRTERRSRPSQKMALERTKRAGRSPPSLEEGLKNA